MMIKKTQVSQDKYLESLKKTSQVVSMSQINIPLSCPSCDGKMYSVRYEAPLAILKERSWQVCKLCGFERNTEDFKKGLFTI